MSVETIDTLIIGAGQAGLAMSEHLTKDGVPHIVLERARIAERWRSVRWDSLVANGPAWHDRFPGMGFDEVDPAIRPDDFAPKEVVADYMEAYARKFRMPVRTGVEVRRLERLQGRAGFRTETSAGVIEAQRIVAATGPFQKPVIPPVIPRDAGVTQIHSADYRNPAQLPDGGVLIVGAGSSGVQIADELRHAGRRVWLSVGPHDRPPRAYRGRDFCWWLGVLGQWDLSAPAPGTEHVTIAVSGAHGGETIDFRRLAQEGMILLGRTETWRNGRLGFAGDLVANLDNGDANHDRLLDQADDYVARNGLDLPPDPQARRRYPDADCITNPIRELDLAQAGISTVIWATGFAVDYSWMKLDAFDASGRPVHQRGVSTEPGVYFLGLPWQSRRGSSFIWGVWHDARHIAEQIGIQRKYLDYHHQNAPQTEPA
ncbi:putative flavoprotein involved in K+ transport [Paracoccus alcaliphilus]|uniref:Putative flavoprotein involved in K+ transport n=1 Tax=Paracoccus alcaliphilus TaxID=34002 RepID=A0A1H8LCH5_9RHOB|nr:NAD(P)/FAD-dependent oxidoreductase [Paracoccus alcaliphilus]WCR20187.1 NAD(P)-binding domain-containing protein [Paracoccus alcaliphilus]SEO02845.1 putative flavoprotein involved in K+ transport [Paracoccus alcaliphilus]